MADAPYEEFISEVSKEAMDQIQAAVENFDEQFPGTPFGQSKLSDEEFVAWFSWKCGDTTPDGAPNLDYPTWVQGRNWMAFLSIEDSGEGQKTLERYLKLREKGLMAPYTEVPPPIPEPVPF